MDKKKIINIIAVALIVVSLISVVIYAKNNNYSAYYISYGGSDPSCPNVYIEDDGDRFYFGRSGDRIYINRLFNYFTDEDGVRHDYSNNVWSSSGPTANEKALIIFGVCFVVIGFAWGIARYSISSKENQQRELDKINKMAGGNQ